MKLLTRFRKWIVLCLFVGCIASIPVALSAQTSSDSIGLIVNGEQLEPDVPPVMRDQRVLVPVRWVAEALDAAMLR